MKIKANLKLISSFFLILLLICSFALKVKADDDNGNIELNLSYPSFGGMDIDDNQDINQIVVWLYYFIVGISGFSAFFMFVLGGFKWSSSAGDPGAIGEAKDMISSATIGVLIILSAYLILQTINPELTTLSLP